MKNKNFNKNLVYPWDIKGYVKLSEYCKEELIRALLSKFKTVKGINENLNNPKYWFNNFKKSDKVNSKHLKKLASLSKINLVHNINQFNDDKGSSSIPFRGRFPIKYTPLWHFIFCLSVGDGHIHIGEKKRFTWYQKPEGQKKLIEILKKLGFDYEFPIRRTKDGIIIPQLIRKVGSFITNLDSGISIRKDIVKISKNLGRDYELSLLCAFFIDEAGMGKLKPNSEITLHQEGNLDFLDEIGALLDRFSVKWSKNLKGDKWCIRFNVEGVVRLACLFSPLNRYGINLLHRQEIFQKKVEIAKKMLPRILLKEESLQIKEYLLDNYKDKKITLNEIRKHFKIKTNTSIRGRQMAHNLKKKNLLEIIKKGEYLIKGE